MSRTYRRRKTISTKIASGWENTFPEVWIASWRDCGLEYRYMYETFDHYPTEKDMKKAVTLFMSDGKTTNFKEPGPAWFRRLYNTRPLRRHNKRELLKFIRNPDYEPMVEEKGKLDYWT